MKKIILIIVLQFSFSLLYSQFKGSSNVKNVLDYNNAAREVQFLKGGEMISYSLDEIQGHPYLFDTFIAGKITLTNDSIINIPVNYNAFLDAFEFEKDNFKFILTNNFKVKKIVANNKSFAYRTYNNHKGEIANGYFEVLFDGQKAQLYKKLKKSFLEGVPSETQFNTPQPPKFSKIENSYFIGFNSEIKFIKTLNKKGVLSVFNSNQESLSRFIKDNNLNFKNEEDIIKIVEHYNTL